MDVTEFRKIILNYRDYYGSYHGNKERMAWVAFVLYASFAVTAMENEHLPGVAVSILFFIYSIFLLKFIAFQLKGKWFGARMVEACSILLFEEFQETKIRVVLSSHVNFPKFMMPTVILEKMGCEKTADGQYRDRSDEECFCLIGSVADKALLGSVTITFLIYLFNFLHVYWSWSWFC